MVWESIVFMFWCAMGTFQAIASWAAIRGLSFFNKPFLGYGFGVLNILAAFCWFFTTIEIGESGAKGQHYEQIVAVLLGVASAGLVTGLLASVIRFRLSDTSEDHDHGIEVFKKMTLFQLARSYFNKREGGI